MGIQRRSTHIGDWLFVLLTLLPSCLAAQVGESAKESKPREAPPVVAQSLEVVEHSDGIDVTGSLLDADSGRYITKDVVIEVTPVEEPAWDCTIAVARGPSQLVWTQVVESNTFKAHLEAGTYKLVFRLPEGRNAGKTFGCEIVRSKTPKSCSSGPRAQYDYTLQTTTRFRNVIGTVDSFRPCQQRVRGGCFVPYLPHQVRSSRVNWLNEDGTPIRDAELFFQVIRESMGPPRIEAEMALRTNDLGEADLAEVYRQTVPQFSESVEVEVTIRSANTIGSRKLKLELRGTGSAGLQTVRVKEWRCGEQHLWAAEIE